MFVTDNGGSSDKYMGLQFNENPRSAGPVKNPMSVENLVSCSFEQYINGDLTLICSILILNIPIMC
jgi:hypothetical protein